MKQAYKLFFASISLLLSIPISAQQHNENINFSFSYNSDEGFTFEPGTAATLTDPNDIGTVGGKGGRPFNDIPHKHRDRIVAVTVCSGTYVDSIQLTMQRRNCSVYQLRRHGGKGGQCHRFPKDGYFVPGEHIIGIKGRAGEYIDALKIVTNLRKFPMIGGRGGRRFALGFDGTPVRSIYGRSGIYLDALGISA